MTAIALSTLRGGKLARSEPPAVEGARIYVVDNEGGQGALWVSPSGQRLSSTAETRDPRSRTDHGGEQRRGAEADRYLISTHSHIDTAGMAELGKRDYAHSSIMGASEVRRSRRRASRRHTQSCTERPSTPCDPETRCRSLTGLENRDGWRNAVKTPLTGAASERRCGIPTKEASPRRRTPFVCSVITFGQFVQDWAICGGTRSRLAARPTPLHGRF